MFSAFLSSIDSVLYIPVWSVSTSLFSTYQSVLYLPDYPIFTSLLSVLYLPVCSLSKSILYLPTYSLPAYYLPVWSQSTCLISTHQSAFYLPVCSLSTISFSAYSLSTSPFSPYQAGACLPVGSFHDKPVCVFYYHHDDYMLIFFCLFVCFCLPVSLLSCSHSVLYESVMYMYIPVYYSYLLTVVYPPCCSVPRIASLCSTTKLSFTT